MIATDYYKGEKDSLTKTRFNVVSSTNSYDYFEQILINKKDPNIGGLSFYLVDRPARWGNRWERQFDKAITKSTLNISSVIVPDPSINIGYGDVKGTDDALIFIISPDWKMIEIFIARGQKNNKINLYQLTCDGELDVEFGTLRKKAGEKGCNENCCFYSKTSDKQ